MPSWYARAADTRSARPTSAMRRTVSIGDFRASAIVSNALDLADGDVRVEELGVRCRDDDVRVGDEVEATAGADAVDGGDHGLADSELPRREPELEVARLARVAAQRGQVAAHLHDVDARSGTRDRFPR